ncbi:hypothetical protein V2O64_10310 [Verrucomicrobiaceae bacterium 227]
MKFVALFTIAILFPFTTHAQDQSEEIAQLKNELKASKSEKEAYKDILTNFAKELKTLLGPDATLEEIPVYIKQLTSTIDLLKAKLDELSSQNEIHEEKNKKLEAELGKALQLEDGVPLQKVPMAVAELMDTNKQLRHRTEEMNATIESLQAELGKLKKK